MQEFLALVGALVIGCAIGWFAGHVLGRIFLRAHQAHSARDAAPLTDDEFNIIDRWATLNRWYLYDAALNREAQAIYRAVFDCRPSQSLEVNLAEVTVEMHRRHPEIAGTRQ
jgi:hypothetical protein